MNDAARPPQPDRDCTADLETRLIALTDRGALLLKRIFMLGETQAEAGCALGLSPEAARKRYRRAIANLRKEFLWHVSHSEPALGLSLLTDRKGRSGMEIGS